MDYQSKQEFSDRLNIRRLRNGFGIYRNFTTYKYIENGKNGYL
jgi:hypothetical protein